MTIGGFFQVIESTKDIFIKDYEDPLVLHDAEGKSPVVTRAI